MLSTLDAVVEKLKDGVKLSDVYNVAVDHVKEKKPELQGNFVKSIGYVPIIVFLEFNFIIFATNNLHYAGFKIDHLNLDVFVGC